MRIPLEQKSEDGSRYYNSQKFDVGNAPDYLHERYCFDIQNVPDPEYWDAWVTCAGYPNQNPCIEFAEGVAAPVECILHASSTGGAQKACIDVVVVPQINPIPVVCTPPSSVDVCFSKEIADLRADAVTVNPFLPSGGEEGITLSACVTNIGTESAGSFNVQFYIDDESEGWGFFPQRTQIEDDIRIQSLAVNERECPSIVVDRLGNFRFDVDADDEVVEWVEYNDEFTNNIAQMSFHADTLQAGLNTIEIPIHNGLGESNTVYLEMDQFQDDIHAVPQWIAYFPEGLGDNRDHIWCEVPESEPYTVPLVIDVQGEELTNDVSLFVTAIDEEGNQETLNIRGMRCWDKDEDGYGFPGSALCNYPEEDCDDDPSDDPVVCGDPDPCVCGDENCSLCARCINVAATEFCDDVDNDCDEISDNRDIDNDDYVDKTCGGNDCNDEDPLVNPGADEICDDEIDQDCDATDEGSDDDGDGFTDEACDGDDCDDTDPLVSPGVPENCDTPYDDNCNGEANEGCPPCFIGLVI